ncbi:hypothetical protein EDB92DRAFT_1889742 [Lactarius akahatsu]|uniref:Uncharacterized protein n=1 Tax=Lactarius akahatsu TaxID=416441 RepID=A0AAD4LAG4_9AGAM|nr:hypothetical protein EDB92DRAFT_1889742 [Lactarius akahatsu]
MATKTQTTPSTFPRIRFGFGPKSSRTRPPPDPPENPDDPDWYIPYNGPYELPPSVPRSQNRDSWSQLLGSVLSNFSGATSPTDRTHERSGAHAAGGKTASHFPGSGAYSSHPYRTSAAQDAAGFLPTTTSRARGGHPTPIITSSTSFAHIDTTGGVGESPTPMRRSPLQTSSQASTANRLSLANLLNFGGSTRRSRSDSMHNPHRPPVKRSRDGPPTPDPLQSNRATGIDVRPPPRSNSLAHVGPSTEYTPRQRSNTLAGTSMSPAPEQSSSLDLFTASQHRDSPLSPHPYAYAYSSSHSGPSRRAPMISPPLTHSHSLDKGKGVDRSYQYPQPPSTDTLNVAEVPPHLRPTSRTSLLKTISAPNLRNLSRGLPIRKPTPSRGKYRWLSPETWCDALLFPRPRFMEHIDGEPPQPLGQRDVSLPSPKAHTLTHTGGERIRTPLGRSWLRGSRSAVNLHVSNLNSSHGPPRAEPMLMAPKGSFEGDEWTSFSRPRSFAQDDLALPSPAPSIVKVLEMGASFERERATWRSQAERSLQSSKLTRSLGRSRSQSVGRTRAQLKDTGGVGFLATKTLLGNQLVAPTVGTLTSSEGTLTQQTRSGTSHARTLSSGHSRAGSKSKIAAIRAATGLCISDDKTSPQNDITRFDGGGKGAGIDGQHNVPNSGTVSPAAVDSSSVGIALSSPPPSTEEVAAAMPVRPIYVVQDHPYAQGGYSFPRRSHARSSSDYAGPHPSAVAVTASASVLASDMSARHRLPPQAVLHPYASSSAQASAAFSQPAPVAQPAPPSVPYQTLPEAPVSLRPRHNPRSPLRNPLALPDTREAERVVPHAYAASNRFSGGALGLADALSYGLQRRGSADSGLGESESHYDAPSSSAHLLSPFPDVTLATTPEYLRSNFGHNSTFLSLHSRRTVASSPPATLNPPVFPASVSADSHRSAQASSVDEPAPGSRASSPLQIPRPFGTIEDLDRYRNLFYYPKAPGASRTPSDDHRRTFSRDTGASLAGLEISSTGSVSSNGGLAALTRQLGNEFGVVQDTTDDPSQMWWTRSGGQRGSRTDPNVAFSTMSDLYSNSDLNTNPSDSDAALLPLSLHQSAHHQSQGSLTVRIPQDVESQPSSVLGRSEMEAVDDELLRVRTVGAASTPLATTPALRLSFVGDVHRGRSQDSLTLGNYQADRASASSTSTADATDNDDDDNGNDNEEEVEEAEAEEDPALLPLLVVPSMRGSVLGPQSVPHSATTTDATRSSYMTNDTGASRISGLSDFPVPPNQTVVSLDRVEVLKSYFAGDDAHAPNRSTSQIDDPAGKAAAVAAAAMRLEQPSLAGPSQSSRERSADGEPELHQ